MFGMIEVRFKIEMVAWQEIVEHQVPILIDVAEVQRTLAMIAEFNGDVHQGIPERRLATAIAAGLAAAEECEVRWNYAGSSREHYVRRWEDA